MVIGHAAVVQAPAAARRARANAPATYEGVGVRADSRRQGHAATMIASTRTGHPRRPTTSGALGATDEAAAALRRARLAALAGGRCRRSRRAASSRPPDEAGSVYVLPGKLALDLSGELTCDWRDADVW